MPVAPTDQFAVAHDALKAMDITAIGPTIPLRGGANNRVFRVPTADGDMILKQYFRHPDDARDRLASEFGFLTFAWQHGLRCIPQPIACSESHDTACYTCLPGSPLRADQLLDTHIDQALAFADELQQLAHGNPSADLSDASEACFTVRDHLRCVDERLARLDAISADSGITARAAAFVRHALTPRWHGLRESVLKWMDANDRDDAPLSAADRCLSPSDFGFHNALCDDRGRLGFIDFEYAGRDDPAKLVCDFFCQPKIPVPMRYLETFIETSARWTRDPARTAARIERLLPVYRIKWCCIILNPFLPRGAAQSQFAAQAQGADRGDLLEERLAAARTMLEGVDCG